jgi:hypothetical protein
MLLSATRMRLLKILLPAALLASTLVATPFADAGAKGQSGRYRVVRRAKREVKAASRYVQAVRAIRNTGRERARALDPKNGKKYLSGRPSLSDALKWGHLTNQRELSASKARLELDLLGGALLSALTSKHPSLVGKMRRSRELEAKRAELKNELLDYDLTKKRQGERSDPQERFDIEAQADAVDGDLRIARKELQKAIEARPAAHREITRALRSARKAIIVAADEP